MAPYNRVYYVFQGRLMCKQDVLSRRLSPFGVWTRCSSKVSVGQLEKLPDD